MSKEQRKIDVKLVIAYQSGNNEALTQLVQRWHKTFCNKAYWIVKDANVAKDIAQDSWSKIIEKIHDLRDPNTFSSWSLRIVCNKSFDWVKKYNKTRLKLQYYNYSEQADDMGELDKLDKKEQLHALLLRAIKTLPAHQQMVIRLFYVEDYSLKDISKMLNISEGTAKSRLYHAREKLKLIIKSSNKQE